MNENSIRGVEQGRAAFAYNRVKDVVDLGTNQEDLRKKYKSGAKKLPVLIKTNGLAQALAYIEGRDNFPKLYDQIDEWLHCKGLLIGQDPMIDQVIAMNSDKYRRITTETLALLNWIRRFVDGHLMADVGGDNL